MFIHFTFTIIHLTWSLGQTWSINAVQFRPQSIQKKPSACRRLQVEVTHTCIANERYLFWVISRDWKTEWKYVRWVEEYSRIEFGNSFHHKGSRRWKTLDWDFLPHRDVRMRDGAFADECEGSRPWTMEFRSVVAVQVATLSTSISDLNFAESLAEVWLHAGSSTRKASTVDKARDVWVLVQIE